MELVFAVVISLIILGGVFFTLTASIGLIRLPDVYTRMHAASKTGTVGSGLMFLAVGLHSGDIATFERALAGFVFFILTAPISAHLLAKAAHKAGYPLHSVSVRDDLEKDDAH